DGAAVDLGGALAMTNSRGEFFLRTKHARATKLKVSFDEFTAVGQFEFVSAPSTVVPEEEERGSIVRIVVRPANVAQAKAQKERLLGIQPQGQPRGGLANAPARGVPRGSAPASLPAG